MPILLHNITSIIQWSHQHSEKLCSWCSRVYSITSNKTLLTMHHHQSPTVSALRSEPQKKRLFYPWCYARGQRAFQHHRWDSCLHSPSLVGELTGMSLCVSSGPLHRPGVGRAWRWRRFHREYLRRRLPSIEQGVDVGRERQGWGSHRTQQTRWPLHRGLFSCYSLSCWRDHHRGWYREVTGSWSPGLLFYELSKMKV